MVFESVITEVLNKTLGNFVENLDTKQLKIGIWNGDVVLHNLKLRENVLDELDLPVQLVYGYIGKLVLNIPWKNLYTKPVVAEIEDFYILVTPKQSIIYNREKEEKYELDAKQTHLKKIEDARKLEMEKDKPQQDRGFVEKLTAQIINNLQVKINNVHIRYEDISTVGNPFSFGITLYGLEIYTADENWEQCYLTEQVNKVFKVANLDSLSAYMNCSSANLFKKYDESEYTNLFKSNIAYGDHRPNQYVYMIGPISMRSHLKLNMNPQFDNPPFQDAKIELDVKMEKLNIGITRTQFQDILKLADTMNRMQMGLPYRKYRPYNISYKGHYKEWWQFAIKCILEENVRRPWRCWSWKYIKSHRQLCKTYANAFKERELSKKVPANIMQTCNLCEKKLDLFNLILIRNRVHLEIDKIKEETPIQETRPSWFSSWWSSGKDEQKPDDLVKKFENAMTPEEKHKLYDAIGYNENTTEFILPVEYEAIKMNFQLIALDIGVHDDIKNSTNDIIELRNILLLNFDLASCEVIQRPAANAIKITAGMKEMKLTGVKRDNFSPILIESIIPEEVNLLDIFFETNPIDKACDQRIKISARPLQLIYDSETILELLRIFSPTSSVNLSQLEGAASQQISSFKERSATGMQYMIDKHDILEINIKFMPNILILPRYGLYNSGFSSAIVVSLGKLTIISAPCKSRQYVDDMFKTGHDHEAILKHMMEQAYDKVMISLDDVQILVGKPKEKWLDVISTNTFTDMHILHPSSIRGTVELCVVSDDPRLPKTKVEILIPSINISLTEDRILEAIRVITSIPLPENDVPEPMPLTKTRSFTSRLLEPDNKQNKLNSMKEKENLTQEIVQYTNLQLTFALKEFSITLYANRDIQPIVDDQTPSDKYITPTADIIALDSYTDFNIFERENSKLLKLTVIQLEITMAQRTYELVASVRLGAINLTSLTIYNETAIFVPIIDTPRFKREMEYLLSISYTNVNKIAPEFMTKYNSTEQLIDVHFSTLQLVLHLECLQNLLKVSNCFQRKLQEFTIELSSKDRVATANDNEGLTTKLAIIPENQEITSDHKLQTRRRPEKTVDSVKIKLLANLDQVSVEITCVRRPISMIKIQHLFAGVILKSSYTELTLILKDILVTDLNHNTQHKNILSIVGDNALNCQVVIYNLDETSNYNLDDLKISVTIGCVKIIFLNWFVASFLSFINNFQAAQQAVVNAGVAAADAAKQNVVDAYEKATRLKLNIKIKAPIIFVPVDSQSLECICVDLGFLKISNFISEIEVENHENRAIFDDIKLELKDMKISKAIIEQDVGDNNAQLVTGSDYGLQSNANILDPISFALILKRNLSNSWYKDQPEIAVSGRLKSIELHLYVDYYNLLMSILNKNLVEGQNEFLQEVKTFEDCLETQIEVHQPKIEKEITKSENIESKKEKIESSQNQTEQTKINEQLKFNFQFDGIVANLIDGDNKGIATFGLYLLSVRGQKLVDGTFSTSIVLCDIQLDDNRPSSRSKITKYLKRKDDKIVAEQNAEKDQIEQIKYMLDIVAILKENDTFVELRVSGFDLIISLDFLMKIVEFFNIPSDDTTKTTESKTVDTNYLAQSPKTKPVQTQSLDKKMKVILYVDEPDIILVETLEDTNAYAIIFNAHMNLNYRIIDDKQLIYGEIQELKMYMCAFLPEKRESTKHYIIHPCQITLQGSTPQDKGLHISLKLSNLIINISPATIELFNKAMLTVSGSNVEKGLDNTNIQNYENIWDVQRYKEKDFWFIKVDDAHEALDADTPEIIDYGKPEKCIVEIPSIALVFETGLGYYTSPMLYIEIKMDICISDWSRQMHVDGSLNLATQYYNSALAVWEPLIEPNEKLDASGIPEHRPWELNFDLKLNSNINIDSDEENKETGTKILVHSSNILELTFSKTCFELLQTLGEDFSQAFDIKGLAKPEVIAPYILENDTGYDINIDFAKSMFTLHECHMPTVSQRGSDKISSALVFQTDDPYAIQVNPQDIKSCTVSPGGRIYLQTKYLSTITADIGDTDEEIIPEYSLKISIGGIKKKIILPLSKADKRYFPLYRDANQDPWGIISEVKSEYGTTKLNIHGVIEVYNHFTTSVKVYRQKQKFEQILVGEIAAGEVFHVPLHAIYATSKELYFSLPGYNYSVQGIRWNENLTDLSYNRQIQCDPVDTFEPLYINATREKSEVYFETTAKYTILSAYYTIHLRPPLYLRNALPINIKVSVAGCSVRQDGVTKNVEITPPKSSIQREDFLDYGEKDIKPGDVLHLPTVKLTSKSGEPKNYIVVRLIQYLEKDWSCTTKISENHNEFETWTFTSYDSVAKMDMELGVRFEDRHGSLMLTVYSPFWMINKTGLMLSYIKFKNQADTGSVYKTNTESLNVLYHPPEYNGPILFSFREKYFFDKKRASIRVDSGEWSDKIPLDVAGSIGNVECRANNMTYQIGVHIHLTQNSLTKHITFTPFHIAINNCNFAIEIQENSRPGDPWFRIEANECAPLWPKSNDNLLIVRICGDIMQTMPFNFTDVQSTLLKLRSEYGGINVDVQVTEGGIYTTFFPYNVGDAPGLIINHTKHEISFWEKGNVNKRILKPFEKVLIAWSDPAGEKLLLWDHGESDLRRDGVGQFYFPFSKKYLAYWVSFLDGLQRVLLFTETESIAASAETSTSLHKVNQELEVNIQGIGLSVVNNLNGNDLLYLGMTSSGIIWESRKKGKTYYKPMKMERCAVLENKYQEYLNDQIVGTMNKSYLDAAKTEINFKDMKLMKPSNPRDIQRTFYPGVWINVKSSPFQMQVHAKINRIQIDNQLSDCIFPVVLAPIPPPKSVAAKSALKPFFECSIVQRVVPNSNVLQFKYCSVLTQEFHFKVDLQFLTALAEMFVTEISDIQAAKLFNTDVEAIQKPLSDLVATHSLHEQKNYYDYLHLGPIKIHVSFSMAGSETTALPSILSTIVQGVGVTLTDVHDVVFRLAFFERDYQFFTQKQLISEIISHFSGQALKQLYVLVFGLDVLGNPFGLVVGIKKGVEDLFYEPFQGAIQGPGEFAEGLVLGVKSLFGHTVGGAAGAVSKITGAMGKGLAALTFDDDYQKKRRQALNKKPANFQEGIARSGKGLVMGVVDGVSGVFTKPISGAKEEGVEGFFKGLGKGAIGLVARPTAGVVDFASGSFDAVKRATANTEDTQRIRPPRFLHFDNILRPYSRNEAEGNKLLKEIDKGKYAQTDTFVYCDEIIEKHEVLILSNHRIIYAIKNDLFGVWTVQWTHMWSETDEIKATDRGVEIVLKKENKKIMGLFSSNEIQRKLILIPHSRRRNHIEKIMNTQKTDI